MNTPFEGAIVRGSSFIPTNLQSSRVTGASARPLQLATIPPGFYAYRLPLLDAERPVVYRNWRRTGKPTGRRHVVVIDDDPWVLDIVGQVLDQENYDATLSFHSLDVVDFTRLRADALFVDASFNRGRDGLSLFADEHAQRRGALIPVIYSTIMPRIALKLSAAGVAVLLKPFDLDEFLEMLAHVCS